MNADMKPDTVGLIVNRAPKGELNRRNQRRDREIRDFIFSVWYRRMKLFMNMTAMVNQPLALPEDNP